MTPKTTQVVQSGRNLMKINAIKAEVTIKYACPRSWNREMLKRNRKEKEKMKTERKKNRRKKEKLQRMERRRYVG